MDPILIAIIVVLCQYPLCILSLIRLFRSNEQKKAMIVWNVFIVAVPIIGVASYWIYYAVRGRKKTAKTAVAVSQIKTTDNENEDNTEIKTENSEKND